MWLALLAAVLIATAPSVEANYYSIELGRGSYPTDADSIGLPIAQFTIGLLVVSPILLAVCWVCLRSYPGSVSLGHGIDAALVVSRLDCAL
jgi:hypothetical protein